jgi:hypothetical protein
VATKRGWFAILDARGLDLPAILAHAARRAPRDARPDEFLVVSGPAASVEVMGWALGHVESWAQAVSLEARRTTIGLFTLEGQWSYVVYDAGAVIGGMAGYPLEVPALYGDIDRVAKLIGTTRATLEHYCHSEDEDDQFDLARSLGISDPRSKAAKRVPPPAVSNRASWTGLAKGPRRPQPPARKRSPADKVRPGWNNRHRFPIVTRMAGTRTTLEVPGTPAMRVTDSDADRALRRLEASVLDHVAAQAAADRFPFDTIEFLCGISRDAKQRDLIVLGRVVDWRRIPTGRLEFSGLTGDQLARLIHGGFVDPEAPDNDGVRPCDWLRALERHPGVSLRGVAFAPSRPDYRTEFAGLEGPHADAARRAALREAKAAAPTAPDVGHELVVAARPAARAAALRKLARELRRGSAPAVDYVRIRTED